MTIADTNIWAPTFLDWILENTLIVILTSGIVILLVAVGILAFVSYRRRKIRATPIETNALPNEVNVRQLNPHKIPGVYDELEI